MSLTTSIRVDAPPQPSAATTVDQDAPQVDIVVPVFNEAAVLEASIRRLHDYLTDRFPLTWRITIADNASTDRTWSIARDLADELSDVHAVRLPDKGRGRAIHAVWSASDGEVLVYMDVDLSTELSGLYPLVAPLLSGHSDLAIGTRLAIGSSVIRGPKREALSRGYNMILRTVLRARFTDAQCGFKAIRRDRAQQLLPLVEDRSWFFDTELLVLAQRHGMRIHEVPVDWVDDPDSRVDIVRTARDDLRGVLRLLGPGREVATFAVIGVASTLAYLLLYAGLRVGMPVLAANAVALLVTAVANTAANRRLTFNVRGRDDAARHHAQGLGIFVVALVVTTAALRLLLSVDPQPSRTVELVTLVVANLGATALRYLLLRGWVFRARPVRSPR
jgi:glycosyltransferase involved in cell wall biosynthesis